MYLRGQQKSNNVPLRKGAISLAGYKGNWGTSLSWAEEEARQQGGFGLHSPDWQRGGS